MSTNKTSGSLHITKKVDYGLFLLAILAEAEPKTQLSIKTIADESKISFPFLQKVARHLQKAKLIKAERGKYGGYSLIKNPKKITLKDVIETLDGQIALTTCLHKNSKKCKREGFCRVKKGLAKINAEIKKNFMKKTLDQIIS